MSKTKIETKTLDHSDVKYGILRINSGEIASCLPTFYYPITVPDEKIMKTIKGTCICLLETVLMVLRIFIKQIAWWKATPL